MIDCIEREPLLAWLSNMEVSENIIKVIADPERFTTVDVKHGHWIPISEQHQSDGCFWTESFLKCSLCEYKRRIAFIKSEPDFCEGCGADMRSAENG